MKLFRRLWKRKRLRRRVFFFDVEKKSSFYHEHDVEVLEDLKDFDLVRVRLAQRLDSCVVSLSEKEKQRTFFALRVKAY